MPLLYGEGRNAFIRLQLEILRTSDDETVFAWDGISDADTGLLAPSPAEFRNSADIRRITFDKDRPEYAMTNKGLRMALLLGKETVLHTVYRRQARSDVYLAPLNCTRDLEGHPLAIYLKKDADGEGNETNRFARCFPRAGAGLTTVKLMQNLKESELVWATEQARAAKYHMHPVNLMQSAMYSEKSAYFQSTYLLEPMQRHTVYVRQRDGYTDSNAACRPRRFSIRYPWPTFTISEVRLRSGLASWEEGDFGECAVWLDRADEAALIVFNLLYIKGDKHYMRAGDRCSILLMKLPNDSARADLAAVNALNLTGTGFLNLFERQMSTEHPTDQISRYLNPLQRSVSLSVKVRPELFSGNK
jgi:hypothetical protein